MSAKSLRNLGNPEHSLLGPNYKSLKFWGLLLPQNAYKSYFFYIQNCLLIFFAVTECIECFYNFYQDDVNVLLNSMKTTLPLTVTTAKVITFVCWPKQWKAIIYYALRADLVQRSSSNASKMNILNKHTKYCRIKTYLFWAMVFIQCVIIIAIPILKYSLTPSYRANTRNGTENYVEMFSLWVPFNKSTLLGFLGATVYESWAVCYTGGWLMTFDTTAMVLMVFFRCELEMLRIDSANIFGNETELVEDEVALNRLKDCHRRHVEMIKYARLLNSYLSPIMFQNTLVCSVMLCTTVYQITNESSAVKMFQTAEYFLACFAQLFIYYWHSNDVLYASQDLMLGPYESLWWKVNVKRRKDVYILTEQFKTIVVFSAGPFSYLTLPSFINILRASYSYYAILSTTQTN